MRYVVSLFCVAMLIAATSGPAMAAALREQQVLELIASQAALRFQVPRADVVVEWQDLKLASMVSGVPEGAVTLELPDSARLAGRTNVPVQILVDGRKFRTIFPRVDIKVFQKVLVTKRNIGRGELVSEADVQVVRQAVGDTQGEPLRGLGTLAGAEAIREIPAGSPLTASMFKLPTVVKRGSVVAVTVKVGGLTILTNGEAKSDGALGQMVKVLNLESKREYAARVTGPDRVEIKMEEDQ